MKTLQQSALSLRFFPSHASLRAHRSSGSDASQGIRLQRDLLRPLPPGRLGALAGRTASIHTPGPTLPERLRLPTLQPE